MYGAAYTTCFSVCMCVMSTEHFSVSLCMRILQAEWWKTIRLMYCYVYRRYHGNRCFIHSFLWFGRTRVNPFNGLCCFLSYTVTYGGFFIVFGRQIPFHVSLLFIFPLNWQIEIANTQAHYEKNTKLTCKSNLLTF